MDEAKAYQAIYLGTRDAIHELFAAKARVRELEAVIEAALDHSLANRDGEYEFFRAYSYPVRTLPQWVRDAKAALATVDAEKGNVDD